MLETRVGRFYVIVRVQNVNCPLPILPTVTAKHETADQISSCHVLILF